MSKMLDIMSAQSMRETLEGLPRPICTKRVSSKQLIQLQLDTLCELLKRFGTLDEEEAPTLEAAWRETLERQAVVNYGLKYYKDSNTDKLSIKYELVEKENGETEWVWVKVEK